MKFISFEVAFGQPDIHPYSYLDLKGVASVPFYGVNTGNHLAPSRFLVAQSNWDYRLVMPYMGCLSWSFRRKLTVLHWDLTAFLRPDIWGLLWAHQVMHHDRERTLEDSRVVVYLVESSFITFWVNDNIGVTSGQYLTHEPQKKCLPFEKYIFIIFSRRTVPLKNPHVCVLKDLITMRCHYNVIIVLTNIYKNILPVRATYGVSFVDPVSDWYSVSVLVIIYVISYNIGIWLIFCLSSCNYLCNILQYWTML